MNGSVGSKAGRSVPQDDAEVAKWYRLAAEQNNAFAQTNLGTMFSGGRGVPQAYAQAYMWFTVSAGQGDRDATLLEGEPSTASKANMITDVH